MRCGMLGKGVRNADIIDNAVIFLIIHHKCAKNYGGWGMKLIGMMIVPAQTAL